MGAGYFMANAVDKREGPLSLHRAIWTHYNGPIKDGYVIHHIDENKTNNDISNLQMMTRSDHCALHSNSEESLAKSSSNFTNMWKDRIRYPMICEQCKKEYTTPFPDRSKFCCTGCRSKAYRIRRDNK